MSNYLFHDGITLAEKAEELGKKAIKLGLIPSFTVHHYSDSQEFYIPDESIENSKSKIKENHEISLTAPEAYMKFKKLVESALSQV
ncbi:MAG TPA: hypothetical protein V6D25_16120 [Leptolyngbyaceae cyanobacterium]